MLLRKVSFNAIALLVAVSAGWGHESSCETGALEEYRIGSPDVLEIKVWNHPDLSAKVVVNLDGDINYSLIGRIQAASLTTGQLADNLASRLADGFIKNPQVTVNIAEYKSKKVFVSGAIAKPGTYYLQKATTLVELIARAGGQHPEADREILIVRPRQQKGTVEPVKQVVRIDFRAALEGSVSQNIHLRNGDSVFVPHARSFFIMGEVKKPGKYSLEKGTTILNAISLAGGETAKASIDSTRIIRGNNTKKVEKEVKLDANVRPNDIIIVPESFF